MLADFLRFTARHGRVCLVLGLVAGLALPDLAAALRPHLPELIAALLFLAAFRIGPARAVHGLSGIRNSVATVLVYQLAAPLLALGLAWALGLRETAAALALVLVLAAPSVSGSPNFTIMLGRDPAVAMRLLLVGTALFPATAVPVLILSPAIGSVSGVIESAIRLIAVIYGAVGIAFVLRHYLKPSLEESQIAAFDGAAAILLAIVVVGLMSAAGPALLSEAPRFFAWLGFAFAVNFGMQLLAFRFMPVVDEARERAGTSIVAGNRNVALFLVALPADASEALLLFIGCYQIPMYLTPIVMGRLLGRDG
jgi:hypothetical protein